MSPKSIGTTHSLIQMAQESQQPPNSPAPLKQLISPPMDATSFEIDGVVYHASEDIGIKRYKIMQRLDLQFGFETSVKGVWDATTEIKKVIDERKSISEIAYINEGLRRGITNIDRQEIYPLQVLGLWYNTVDEDILTYNHESMMAKMNRWEAGGLSMGFVFAKAAGFVRGFREIWLSLAQQQEQDQKQLSSDPSPSPQ